MNPYIFEELARLNRGDRQVAELQAGQKGNVTLLPVALLQGRPVFPE